MSKVPGDIPPTWLAEQQEIEATLPDPSVMGKLHVLFQNVLFGNIYVEGGEEGRQEIRDHQETGGSFQIHMSHLRRWAPIYMAFVTKEESLKPLELRTGITARSGTFKIPVVGKSIVAKSGAKEVERKDKVKDETPEERAIRREHNEATQAIGGRWLAHGYNWLIYTEGNSRVYIQDGDELKRIPRQPDVPLPVFSGFVKSLNNMTPEERERVKILGIGEHYPYRHTPFGATLYVSRPERPVDGTDEEKLQQGQDLMDKVIAGAARSAWLRRNNVTRETIENFSGISG
jgi:hypothetical protein